MNFASYAVKPSGVSGGMGSFVLFYSYVFFFFFIYLFFFFFHIQRNGHREQDTSFASVLLVVVTSTNSF